MKIVMWEHHAKVRVKQTIYWAEMQIVKIKVLQQ